MATAAELSRAGGSWWIWWGSLGQLLLCLHRNSSPANQRRFPVTSRRFCYLDPSPIAHHRFANNNIYPTGAAQTASLNLRSSFLLLFISILLSLSWQGAISIFGSRSNIDSSDIACPKATPLPPNRCDPTCQPFFPLDFPFYVNKCREGLVSGYNHFILPSASHSTTILSKEHPKNQEFSPLSLHTYIFSRRSTSQLHSICCAALF